MREFVLYSRTGKTDSDFDNLHDAGRLDITHECIIAGLFLSHALRKDAVFHSILNGPPSPPLHIEVNGQMLHDVRTDLQTWTRILKKVLQGKPHSGITSDKKGFEVLIKEKAKTRSIYVLEERGKDICEIRIDENPVFVVGDHVGLPEKAESLALRYGEKVSLGQRTYLAASCITVINYLLDARGH